MDKLPKKVPANKLDDALRRARERKIADAGKDEAARQANRARLASLESLLLGGEAAALGFVFQLEAPGLQVWHKQSRLGTWTFEGGQFFYTPEGREVAAFCAINDEEALDWIAELVLIATKAA